MCKEFDSTLRAQVKQLVALLFPSFLPPSFLPSLCMDSIGAPSQYSTEI